MHKDEERKLTEKQKVGETGENIADRYLKGKGYVVVERNWKRPWGELDIVAMKDGVLHFVEVKALSHLGSIAIETFTPEDHMHYHKVKCLSRAMQTYLVDHYKEGSEPDFQLDLVAVELNMDTRHAKVRFYEDLEIGE